MIQNAGLPLCDREIMYFKLKLHGVLGIMFTKPKPSGDISTWENPWEAAYGKIATVTLGYKILSLRKSPSDLVVTDLV